MRRADRLFRLIEFLRAQNKAVTGRDIADALEVSLRTVYRDIADLIASGVPIEGERGVGYILGYGFDIPPIMFDREELDAAILGAEMVSSWADDTLKAAAARMLAKIRTVLPDNEGRHVPDALVSFPSRHKLDWTIDFDLVRNAIHERRKLTLTYKSLSGSASERIIWPIVLQFVAPVWLIGAWCELRNDFRTFRVDKIDELEMLEAQFKEQPSVLFNKYWKRAAQGAAQSR